MLLDGFAAKANDAIAFPPEWPIIDAHREALNPVPVYQAQSAIRAFTQPFLLNNFTGLSRDAGFFAEMLATEPEIYGYACSPLDNSEVDAITLPGCEVLARFKNRRLDFNIVDSECSDAAPLLRSWHGQRLPYPPSLSWILTLSPARTYFHYDPPYGDCFMFLCQGRKLWLFISPQDIAAIEQRHGFEIVNSLPLPDLIKLDNGYLRGRIHVGEMGAGDLMYFPQGWAHYVLTSEDSFGYGGYFGGQEQD